MNATEEVLIILAFCTTTGAIVAGIIKLFINNGWLKKIFYLLWHLIIRIFGSSIYFSTAIFIIGIYSFFISIQSLNLNDQINNLNNNIASTSYEIQDTQLKNDVLVSNEDSFISKNDTINVISGICHFFSCNTTPDAQEAYYAYLQLASDLNQTSSVTAEVEEVSSTVISIDAQDPRLAKIKTLSDYFSATKLSVIDSANAKQFEYFNQIQMYKNQQTSSSNQQAIDELQFTEKSWELIFAGFIATIFALLMVISEAIHNRKEKA